MTLSNCHLHTNMSIPVFNILTDVSYRLKRAFLHHLGAGWVGHVLDECSDEAWPETSGQLHHGDHLNALGGSAGSETLSTESAQDVLFGGESDVLRHGEPPLLILGPEVLIVGVQEVLQLNSCLLSANSAVTTVVENFGESPDESYINRRGGGEPR